MLNKIKSWFGHSDKKDEVLEIDIKKTELDSWISDKEEEIQTSSKNKIDPILETIKELIKQGENNLEELKNAELQNKNIPQRAHQIMEGNRVAYIKKTLDFFYKIDLDPDDLWELTDSIAVFNSELNNLNKSNMKSFQVLGEFFANESSRVSKTIKEIENQVEKIYEILSSTGFSHIKDIKELINKDSERVAYIVQLKQDLIDKEKELKSVNNQKHKLTNKLSDMKESKEFQGINIIKGYREKLVSKMKKEDDHLSLIISSIEPGLKKYERIIIDSTLLKLYLDNPVQAIISDTKLEIMAIIETMKKTLINNQLEIKDKKREKLIENIERINPDDFTAIQKKLNEYRRDKKIYDEKLGRSMVIQNFNEHEYQLNHMNNKIDVLNRELSSISKAIEKINPDEFNELIVTKINKAFNVKVNLIV